MKAEGYKTLSDAKPIIAYRRMTQALRRDTDSRQQEEAHEVELEGRRQRLAASLGDLVAMGLPASEILEVVSLLPVRGIKGSLARRKANESIPVRWHTTVYNREYGYWRWDWLDRVMVVDRLVGGYALDNVSNDSFRSGNASRWLLASGEVGIELHRDDLQFIDEGFSFASRGCVGILADHVVSLDNCYPLSEKTVGSFEDNVFVIKNDLPGRDGNHPA
jgi:hypothetical protein